MTHQVVDPHRSHLPAEACGCGPEVTLDAATEDVPIACSLGGDDLGDRLDRWQQVLAHVAREEPLIGGKRMVFRESVPVGELAELAAAEQACCRFFTFRLAIDRNGVALEVTAPPEAEAMIEMVFGGSGR
jgi:hypothetical protein